MIQKKDIDLGEHKHFRADRRIFVIFQGKKQNKNEVSKKGLQHCIASPLKTLHAKNC